MSECVKSVIMMMGSTKDPYHIVQTVRQDKCSFQLDSENFCMIQFGFFPGVFFLFLQSFMDYFNRFVERLQGKIPSFLTGMAFLPT